MVFALFLVVIFSFVILCEVIGREGWVFCASQEIGWKIISEIIYNVLGWTSNPFNSMQLLLVMDSPAIFGHCESKSMYISSITEEIFNFLLDYC